MKKHVVLILILSIGNLVFPSEDKIFQDVPGSYAIYYDRRFDNDTIIGVCYAGSNTLLVRSYNTVTKSELVLLLQFEVDGSRLSLSKDISSIKGDLFNGDPANNRLIPMIMNWSNSWYKSKNKIMEKGIYHVTTDDDYYYSSLIPIFNIEYIGKRDDIEVVAVGKLNNNKDPLFFEFNKIPSPIDSEKYIIKTGKKLEINIDGLKIYLDSNWTTEDNRMFRISNKTIQDAAFLVETINYKEHGLPNLFKFVYLIFLSNLDTILLWNGSTIIYEDGIYIIKKRMYDVIQNNITIQYMLFIDRGKYNITVITLACYETLYKNNKSYFDSLIK